MPSTHPIKENETLIHPLLNLVNMSLKRKNYPSRRKTISIIKITPHQIYRKKIKSPLLNQTLNILNQKSTRENQKFSLPITKILIMDYPMNLIFLQYQKMNKKLKIQEISTLKQITI